MYVPFFVTQQLSIASPLLPALTYRFVINSILQELPHLISGEK